MCGCSVVSTLAAADWFPEIRAVLDNEYLLLIHSHGRSRTMFDRSSTRLPRRVDNDVDRNNLGEQT